MVSATQHGGRLFPSSVDHVALGQAVEERFIELLDLYQRTTGNILVPPPELDMDIKRWREMRIRHSCKNRKCPYLKKMKHPCNRLLVSPNTGQPVVIDNHPCCGICGKRGDYRHTEAEMISTKAIADWTLEEKAKLCKQEMNKVEWK